jgi:hypothetical protein
MLPAVKQPGDRLGPVKPHGGLQRKLAIPDDHVQQEAACHLNSPRPYVDSLGDRAIKEVATRPGPCRHVVKAGLVDLLLAQEDANAIPNICEQVIQDFREVGGTD